MSRHGVAAVGASAAVLAITLGFYGYANLAGRTDGMTYELDATFLSSNGLHPGADVAIAGVRVGSVIRVELDSQSLTSRVKFTVGEALRLPVDSRLSIGSLTLTSASALLISPGRSTDKLLPDAMVTDTCAAANLEQQISNYIFGAAGTSSGCAS